MATALTFPVAAPRPDFPRRGHCRIPRFLLAVLLVPALTWSAGPFPSAALLAGVQRRYGEEARARVVAWGDLMAAGRTLGERAKLDAVNDFLNRLEFVDDTAHWHQADYWATPVETLATDGGDCEDLAIAKYFTLMEMGVPVDHLRITYVKSLTLNQAHMVLTWFSTPDATPLVLDNLVPEIKPATERGDLVPVYSFNGTGLWLSRQRGAGKLMGGSEHLDLWRDLLERIGREAQ